MASTYRDTIQNFAPSWFQNRWMTAFLGSVGGVLDDYAERLIEARRQANPYAAGARLADGRLIECDAEVLPVHARDRGIRIYSSEPELSKRYRLSRWRQLKKLRGSHKGELLNLQPFWLSEPGSILPWMRIVFQDNKGTPSAHWATLSPAGVFSKVRRNVSNWNYDGQASKRTRFWLIVHLPAGYSQAIDYDDGSLWDGGAVYDGITAIAIRDMVEAVKEAKAAHSRLAAVIVTQLSPASLVPGGGGAKVFDPTSTAFTLPDGSTSLPTGNWGSIIDPDTMLPTRPWWASWLYEDNP